MDLNIKLEKNTTYLNSGNILSKLSLIKPLLINNNINKPTLIVVSNEKILNNFLKISNFLDIKFYKLIILWDLISLIYNKTWTYIVTKEIFNAKIPNFEYLEKFLLINIKKWDSINLNEIVKKLNNYWYKFNDHWDEWTFKVVWDIISITDFSWQNNYKISFWWDQVEDIIIIKNNSTTKINNLYIWKNDNIVFENDSNSFNDKLIEKFNKKYILNIFDSLDFYKYFDELIKNSTNFINFNSISNNSLHNKQINLNITDLFLEKIEDLKNLLIDNNFNKKIIITKNKSTIQNFIEYNNILNIEIIETSLNNLKSFKNEQIIVICDDNISRIFIKKRIKRSISKKLDLLLQIKPWDYIVHVDHWIWIFKEIVEKILPSTWKVKEVKREYIELEYKNNDKLFVPITEVSRINKYIWVENPKLTPLSTKEWEKKIKKVSEDVEQIAHELLEVYAKRKIQKWFSFESFPLEEVKFINSFDYTYTDDQINIVKEIFADMETDKPMDRLISWDVWFWKTEVAFNSIHKALINNKQAALISPLIVLAYEHYEKAIERFNNFPFNIWVLTRFETPNAIKNTLEKLKTWKIDLIIWTHRLLSEDIQFKDLWLLVIDEEHKFWVKDKEKIKKIKLKNCSEWTNIWIDILSMSATPIPRSLNLALNWIKSISMLTTHPVWRQPIETLVSKFDDDIIFEAWQKEFNRWWQLFFIHNRVETIETMQNYLSKIFKNKKIIITHWQLPWDTLEQRILKFKRKEYDILLSTTVIENWIDFPNVNTIFINDSYNFWISQIHQLRWRVWRSDKKWYCYLLYNKDKIKDDAAKRLKTIVNYSHLWSGFELAIKDLEIRWWWDILGIRQSWQSKEIWINLFLEMLENKVDQLKKEIPLSQHFSPAEICTSIDLNISAFIPDYFFNSQLDKINFYREIESLETIEDLNNIIEDFKEINKNIPYETKIFFDLLKLKIKASNYKIKSIKKAWRHYQIDFYENITIEELKNFLKLDKEAKFIVISIYKLKSLNNNFANQEKFLQYMIWFFEWKIYKEKIKIIK